MADVGGEGLQGVLMGGEARCEFFQGVGSDRRSQRVRLSPKCLDDAPSSRCSVAKSSRMS
jgi:hypothetical protein